MIQKTLRPILDKDVYSKYAYELIAYEMYYAVFRPLLAILLGEEETKENAKKDVLIAAFSSRKIFYVDSFVFGDFTAAISKALRERGAKFNKTRKAFKILLSAFSPEIRSAIAHGEMMEKNKLNLLKKKAEELQTVKLKKMDVKVAVDSALHDLEKQFHRVTPKDLEIPVEMDGFVKEMMRQQYTENINTFADDWKNEAVLRLRAKVEKLAKEGYRADKMTEMIQSEFEVTKKHARFIARQESSLFVSKYRQARYEAAGVNKYIWSSSQDERVRKDHRDLNGRVFSWDNPPIVDKATGKRGHPGEDYNCRCVALPVIQLVGV